MTEAPIQLALAGAHRARSFGGALATLRDQIEVVAVCDSDPATLAAWRDAWAPSYSTLRAFASFERLLDETACTAVFLSTPMPLHAPQAIRALRMGRHVLSEVIAATTLEECWALVEAVEQTGRVYMLAENYTYTRAAMMVRHMVEAGLFGEPIYAEGSYIHDTRDLLFDEAGGLAWRGQVARDHRGNAYPTHGLGPIAQWAGTAGPAATDRLVELATWSTTDATRWRFARERFGANHPAARPGAFQLGDSVGTFLRTERGVLLYTRRDAASPRPSVSRYEFQGTRGCYLSGRHGGEEPLVWLEGRSPGVSPANRGGRAHPQWEPLWRYAAELEHPRWRERAEVARGAGHGGGDFFILEDFVRAVRSGVSPIDVYDAVTWSSVMPLSAQSLARGGAPVAIPDFRRR